MNPQPPLLTLALVLIVTALVCAAIGWVGGWLGHKYQTEVSRYDAHR